MDSSDRPEFVRVLTGLAEIWRYDLTKETIEIWWGAMKDWPIDVFANAAGYLLKNCQFMPSPYDFEQLRKEGETSASEAWFLALKHAEGDWRRGGLLGDALIDRVVAMLGGYREIALTNTGKLGFLERRFREAYDDLLSTDAVRRSLPNLSRATLVQSSSSARGDETEAGRSLVEAMTSNRR